MMRAASVQASRTPAHAACVLLSPRHAAVSETPFPRPSTQPLHILPHTRLRPRCPRRPHRGCPRSRRHRRRGLLPPGRADPPSLHQLPPPRPPANRSSSPARGHQETRLRQLRRRLSRQGGPFTSCPLGGRPHRRRPLRPRRPFFWSLSDRLRPQVCHQMSIQG